MKTVDYIVAGGRRVRCGVPVVPWTEHGMSFPGRPRRKRTDLATLHWTGGEGDARAMFGVLRKKDLSVHFFIGAAGDVWQFNDADALCSHAKGMNDRAVGVEIQNRANAIPLQHGVKRALIKEVIHGREVIYTCFTAPQVRSALALCASICEAYGLPWQVPMEPKTVTRDETIPSHIALPDGISVAAGRERVQRVIPRQLTDAEFAAFRGIVGHFHRTPVGKVDAGLAILEAVAAFEPRAALGPDGGDGVNERPLSELDASIRTFKHEGGVSVGVRFTCPTCTSRHFIAVPWAGVSQYKAGLWTLRGAASLDVLTLSPSVNCDTPCEWPADWTAERKAAAEAQRCKFHGWVQDGKVRW